MAGKFSIYKYVKLGGKGWRYARAAYHPNGKIKPNVVLVKDVNGKAVEEKHSEGSYFLNFSKTWIPVKGDALEAQHQRRLKLNQVEYERLRGKIPPTGPSLVQLGRRVIKDEVDAYLANLALAKRPHKTIQSKRRFLTAFLDIVPNARVVSSETVDMDGQRLAVALTTLDFEPTEDGTNLIVPYKWSRLSDQT